MPAKVADIDGFGRYRVPDYEALIDHPIRFGVFTRLSFAAAGVPHEIILPGEPTVDGQRLCRDLAAICECQAQLFGELPLDRYIFFMNIVAAGFGGLEHRASTVLDVARDALPLPDDPPGREAYLDLLGLCSHEYFHLWNVKRIRPAAFIPYDLARENHTTLLWAFEGFTSYYDDLLLRRAGLLSTEQYLARLAQVITRVHRGSGRRRQTLLASSYDAWTRFYKQDENAPNAIVSYYAKGALVALALDLTIREGTDGRQSLDDLMRALWARHRNDVGVEEDGIERLAAEITGLDLTGLFDTALRSTRDLDLGPLLARHGIELSWAPARSGSGYVPQLAAVLAANGDLTRVARVSDGGPARRAGIAPGDRVIAVDGIHLRGDALAARIARLPLAKPVTFHVLRDDRLLAIPVELRAAPADEAALHADADADIEAARRRTAWLEAA